MSTWLDEDYEVLGAAMKKSKAYTDQEVSKVRTKFAVVASYADLPNPGRTDTIYLVPKAGFVSVYDQYIYENNQYTDIGDTELDLDSYATDLELSQGLATKVDKVEGYGLSKNDFTDAKDTKLAGIETGAQVNVTPDAALDETSINAIQNKAVTEKFEEVEAEILNEDKVAEGNPITIQIGSIGAAKGTELTMSPIQDLHGYNKPWAAGESDQLLDETTAEMGTLDQETGAELPSSGVMRSGFMLTKGATSIFLTCDSSMRFFWYDQNKTYLSNDAVTKNSSVIVPNGTAYFRIIGIPSIWSNPVMVNAGATAKAYCPYSNVCPISGRTQSKIWGSGKNLLPTTLTEIKSINTTGTWSGDAYTINDVTFTVQTDGDKVVGINANGTASADATLFIYGGTTSSSKNILFPGNVKISIGTANNGSTTTFLGVVWSTTQNKFVYGTEVISGGYNMTGFGVRIKSSYNAQNILFKPMIRLSDEDATFVPYVQGDSVTRNYGQTIYGGSDIIETGALMVDIMRVELDTLNWNATTSSGIFYADDDLSEFIGAGKTIIACDNLESVDNVSGLGGARTNPDCSICGYSGSGTHRFYIRWDAKGTSVSDLVSALNGVYACYKLATPQTITLTPAQVNLIKGINYISTDADSIKMTYTINDFVTETEMDTALESKANVIDLNGKADLTSFGPLEEIIASTNYAEGDYMIFEGKFCKASSAITAGDTLEIGTNLTETTIAAELLSIISQLPTT